MPLSFPELIDRIEKRVTLHPRLKQFIFAHYTLGQDFVRCDLLKQAYAMAYVTLLSLIPSLAAIFCLLSIFSPSMGKDSSLIPRFKEFILENLATGSGEAAVGYINNMIGNISLASIGWTGFAGMMVTLILLLRQIEGALNRIFLVRKGRTVWIRFIYFWTFLSLGTFVIAMAIGVSSGFNVGATVEGASSHPLVRSLISFIGAFLFFFFMFKVVPNCHVSSRHAAIGAAVSGFLLPVAMRLFSVYATNLSNQKTIYGALAALPIFLMWLYICWLFILLGGVIAWRMQQGFPAEEKDDTLDNVQTPIEKLRNLQMRSTLPFICLMAVYKHFQNGAGTGLSSTKISSDLKLPIGWVGEAMDALENMKYVVLSHSKGIEELEHYFPAYPAKSISFGKILTDLRAPATEWLEHWNHEFEVDLKPMIHELISPDHNLNGKQLDEVLAQLS